jgi:hypothetical protein
MTIEGERHSEPGAVQDILAADHDIPGGDYHTLDEPQAALEERQCQEDGPRQDPWRVGTNCPITWL